MKKLTISALVALSVLAIGPAKTVEGATPYVDGSKPFIAIEDVNRQAEAWAMCAATYDFAAKIFAEEQPARSQQLNELGNGAEVAVTMAVFSGGLDPEISQERFNALWSVAKLSGTEIPKTRMTILAAEEESYAGNNNKVVFLENISATIEVCLKNLEGQQMLIDTWRELAKSGLLQVPKE